MENKNAILIELIKISKILDENGESTLSMDIDSVVEDVQEKTANTRQKKVIAVSDYTISNREIPLGMGLCPKCKEQKPIEEVTLASGHTVLCKNCFK